MKYYIIAGEPSGDLHGSLLIRALKEVDAEAEFRVWGGDLMENEGAQLVKHYRDLAFMGVWQVIKNLPTIFQNLKFCKKDIEAYQPDVLIHIDYSGFNLRIAKWAKKEGFKTFYYISPQVWASRAKRVETIKQVIDRMFVILPFEQEFYRKLGYSVEFIGHPLVQIIDQQKRVADFRTQERLSEKPIIALLPGSRKQEIQKMLAVMLEITDAFPDYQFVIAGAPSMERAFYQPYVAAYPNVHLVENRTYPLLREAKAALVTSGTATLETALFEVPQVVCYKANALFYWIAKRVIKVEYIAIVNLIMKREIVRELIQSDFNPDTLRQALANILEGDKRQEMLTDYAELRQKLGPGDAPLRAAKEMKRLLQGAEEV